MWTGLKPKLLTVAVILTCAAAAARGQGACGLSSMQDKGTLAYPPIARAARVEGSVNLLVRFGMDGRVTAVRVIAGPMLLRAAAVGFVKDWQANAFSGPRECPVSIGFRFSSRTSSPMVEVRRIDLQHVEVTTDVPVLYSQPVVQYSVVSATTKGTR